MKNHNINKIELKITLTWNLMAYKRQFGWGDSLLKCNKGLHKVCKLSAIAKACLTVSEIPRTETKVGYSDQLVKNGINSYQKGSYDRDNRVISSKSPYRRRSLPPRC